jgi:hypothetical protein
LNSGDKSTSKKRENDTIIPINPPPVVSMKRTSNAIDAAKRISKSSRNSILKNFTKKTAQERSEESVRKSILRMSSAFAHKSSTSISRPSVSQSAAKASSALSMTIALPQPRKSVVSAPKPVKSLSSTMKIEKPKEDQENKPPVNKNNVAPKKQDTNKSKLVETISRTTTTTTVKRAPPVKV